jgi:predicted aspartyl protease
MAFRFSQCFGIVAVSLFPFYTCSAESTGATNHPMPVTVSISSRHGRVFVPAKVNGSKPLTFLLDTGYGITTIHPDLVESLGLTRSGYMTIVGIAGEERAGIYSGAEFDLNGAVYKPRRIASLPSEAQMSRRGRDGILGAGFFRRFVVEIDPAKNILRLHDPENFHYTGKGEILPLQFIHDTPIIEAVIVTPQKKEVRDRFEVDTGCDDSLCLNPEFVTANQLIEADNNSSGVKNGVGGNARVERGTLPEFRLGNFVIEKPSVNFFKEGSPAEKGLAGHIGMAALHRYKIIFDYSRKQMILEAAR